MDTLEELKANNTLIRIGVEQLIEETQTLRAMLRKHQWQEVYSGIRENCCPECGNREDQGHAPDCALKALIGDEP